MVRTEPRLPPWAMQLRAARRALGLSLAGLAARSGIPAPTLKAYELGHRRPSRARLAAILDTLEPDQSVRNDVALALGYAPERGAAPSRSMSRDEAAAAVDERPWPSVVMSELIEMHAANDLMLTLWGIDRARLADPILRNVLSMVTDAGIANRCLNWEEAVEGIIALFKAHRGRTESLEHPSSYFAAVLDRLNTGAPILVRRFIELWERTPAAPPNKITFTYPIVWRLPGMGAMRFVCVATTVNEVDSLDIDDWLPADATSHRILELLSASL